MLAEVHCIARVWLRGGKAGAARGATPFLAELRALLGAHRQVTLVRADSGFFFPAMAAILAGARGLI